MENEKISRCSLMNRTYFEFNQNFWICFIERLPVSGCALNSSNIVSQHFRNANCLCCDCEYFRWRISMISWYCLNSPNSTVFSFSVNRKRLSSIFPLDRIESFAKKRCAGTANCIKKHNFTKKRKLREFTSNSYDATGACPLLQNKFNTGNVKLTILFMFIVFSAQIPTTITTRTKKGLN